jgi:hypothetical protein
MIRTAFKSIVICATFTLLSLLTVSSVSAASIHSTPPNASFHATFTLHSKAKKSSVIPNISVGVGSSCSAEIVAYKITSTELGGYSYTTCDGTVAAIDTNNKVYYCTNGFPSIDLCLNWQIKSTVSSCITGPTSEQNCPPGGEDTYNVGTDQLWRYQTSVCVEFASGTVDCDSGAIDVAF